MSRTCKYASSFYRWGMKRRGLTANPFAELRTGPQTNPARQAFIDRATIAKVIDAAPSAEWRLLIALSRFGGLRVPSEALRLRWSDVNWEASRIAIRSPKTEHHKGGAERVIPIFPELRTHLLEVFGRAPEGEDQVFPRFAADYNPHTTFERIVRRAGVTPWPRLWHNLRASRQTELAQRFPIHTVCAWIGNSAPVAMHHYLQLTDADFERAIGADAADSRAEESGAESGASSAQKAAQPSVARKRTQETSSAQVSDDAATARSDALPGDSVQNDLMGVGGLEPSTLRV